MDRVVDGIKDDLIVGFAFKKKKVETMKQTLGASGGGILWKSIDLKSAALSSMSQAPIPENQRLMIYLHTSFLARLSEGEPLEAQGHFDVILHKLAEDIHLAYGSNDSSESDDSATLFSSDDDGGSSSSQLGCVGNYCAKSGDAVSTDDTPRHLRRVRALESFSLLRPQVPLVDAPRNVGNVVNRATTCALLSTLHGAPLRVVATPHQHEASKQQQQPSSQPQEISHHQPHAREVSWRLVAPRFVVAPNGLASACAAGGVEAALRTKGVHPVRDWKPLIVKPVRACGPGASHFLTVHLAPPSALFSRDGNPQTSPHASPQTSPRLRPISEMTMETTTMTSLAMLPELIAGLEGTDLNAANQFPVESEMSPPSSPLPSPPPLMDDVLPLPPAVAATTTPSSASGAGASAEQPHNGPAAAAPDSPPSLALCPPSWLACPSVVQEYVNHSGVLLKVYVVGKYVRVFTRPSLPDLPAGNALRTLYASPRDPPAPTPAAPTSAAPTSAAPAPAVSADSRSSGLRGVAFFDSQKPYPSLNDLLKSAGLNDVPAVSTPVDGVAATEGNDVSTATSTSAPTTTTSTSTSPSSRPPAMAAEAAAANAVALPPLPLESRLESVLLEPGLLAAVEDAATKLSKLFGLTLFGFDCAVPCSSVSNSNSSSSSSGGGGGGYDGNSGGISGSNSGGGGGGGDGNNTNSASLVSSQSGAGGEESQDKSHSSPNHTLVRDLMVLDVNYFPSYKELKHELPQLLRDHFSSLVEQSRLNLDAQRDSATTADRSTEGSQDAEE